MASELASKVIVVEEEPRVRAIPSAPTSVAGMVGVAERGPLNEPVVCLSFDDFVDRFGGFIADSHLAAAVAGFFENGGSRLWVVRTCHHTDYTDPATATAVRSAANLVSPGAATKARITSQNAAPFLLANGATLVFSINGGGDQTITVSGTAAYVETTGAGPFALGDQETIIVTLDGGNQQTVVLDTGDFIDIGAATADELALVLNRDLYGCRAEVVATKLRITSDTIGTDSAVALGSGTAHADLGWAAPTASTGNVGNVRAVDEDDDAIFTGSDCTLGFDATGHLYIETVATGAAASVEVKAASHDGFNFVEGAAETGEDSPSTTVAVVEGKDPGTYADDIDVEVEAATSGVAAEFDLVVEEDGRVKETWPNLSADPTAARYYETIVNDANVGSKLIRIMDQDVPGSLRPTNQTVSLAGGNDGLVDIADVDFIGYFDPDAPTAMQSLVKIQELALLAVPGQATAAIQGAMVTFCSETRSGEVFPVFDPPEGSTAQQAITYFETTASLLEGSEFGAMYWPWIKVVNPSRTVFGNGVSITVPPSGHILGIYARTDASQPGGVYQPPAGIERGIIRGCIGFETDAVLLESVRDWVYPKRINPLTTAPGLPKFVDGSRTAKATGNFPYVAERRGVIFIERSLKAGIQWARHSNNTPALRRRVNRTITAFLLTQMRNGAFRSQKPTEAFFVDVSDELNPETEVFAGRLNIRVGLATNKPAEFIILRITQDTRKLEEQLAAASS